MSAAYYDFEAMLHGIRIRCEIARQPALKPYVVEEVMPGADVTSEAELRADIRARGVSNLHPVGTCRMGREPDAVVDPQLRVHGIGALRVADASIMPAIGACNTNAPAIKIGEEMRRHGRRAAPPPRRADKSFLPIEWGGT